MLPIPKLIALLVTTATAAGPVVTTAPKADPLSLIATQDGRLPIIISAPHGGNDRIPGVPPRKGEGMERGPSGFFTGRDAGTEELAHAIAAAIEDRTGKKPYFVVAKFARTFIDPNRPAEIAYEHPAAKPVYDAYHDALTAQCKAVQKQFGRGLLIDVHGQGSAKDTVFRGTNNGATVKLLRERFGEKAHTGPKSLFGLLAENGCKVYPTDPTAAEQRGYTGGYIIRHYGSGGGFGIDAVQLEFGGDYRSADHTKDTAKKVAAAVAGFTDLYLTDAR